MRWRRGARRANDPEPPAEHLHERLVAAIVGTLGPTLRRLAGEHLYAVALTTDDDVMTVDLLAHTEEALARLTGGAVDEDGTDGEAAAYLRWWPDEWGASSDDVAPDDGAETLVTLSRALADAGDAAPDHDRWRTRGRDLLDAALGDERVRAALAAHRPVSAPVLFVTTTDGDLARTVASLDALNPDHPRPALVAAARAYLSS
ncbi:DUF4303 domain-containing protein [Nocardioides zeae]|uniref:DUF4303 domain-containing protein n=1 Tax=Nocardioides imazamoxiresistens TaxID=3231893 RepID=A0ABU3PXM5_9ACTN|nr:DUF4303 domain-containing protein [Nocardioides zeae]MDT9593998.1 DUF4303 domain-containing protein [Nocardioides zeae]